MNNDGSGTTSGGGAADSPIMSPDMDLSSYGRNDMSYEPLLFAA